MEWADDASSDVVPWLSPTEHFQVRNCRLDQANGPSYAPLMAVDQHPSETPQMRLPMLGTLVRQALNIEATGDLGNAAASHTKGRTQADDGRCACVRGAHICDYFP